MTTFIHQSCEEAYDEIRRIQMDANIKIARIVSRKENVGEIPFFFTCVLDTMEVLRTTGNNLGE